MTVQRAILQLRGELGLTQQDLAVKLGSAVSAIPKYEAGRIPCPRALLHLFIVSYENGRHDTAAIFLDHLRKDLGLPEHWQLLLEPKTVVG